MSQPGRGAMRPVIEKELLYYDILYALDREEPLNELIFQGGTSLRLCRRAPRFSEDLDFAGGRDFRSADVARIRECIEDYVSRRYQLEVTVKEPGELRQDPTYRDIRVDKWQVAVTTAPAKRDMPRQRIKLEIANIPAYTRELRPIQIHYPFLPDGYAETLVATEKLDEIMADKLVSLANTQNYVRYRDIWDLGWLQQQQARPDTELVANKLSDYSVKDYAGRVRDLLDRLPGIVSGSTFQTEMTRFLPADALQRTFERSGFTDFMTREISGLFQIVLNELEGPGLGSPTPEFEL